MNRARSDPQADLAGCPSGKCAWHAAVSGAGSGCHRHLFAFIDSAGKNVLYPTKGSLAIGDGSAQCPYWSSVAPPGCPGFERILTRGFDP